MRIAINGMGRIGRLLFKRLLAADEFEVVAVNDVINPENLAYLLKYDSVYGTSAQVISIGGRDLIINEHKIPVFSEKSPENLPWKELEIDVVLECTGMFTNNAGAERHLNAGAKKVLISTTGADDVPLQVFGHNQNGKTKQLPVLSIGGCMTNCSVHVLYLLNTIGIESAHINILHSYTSRQSLVDAANKQFRRGRAAAESIIPVDIDLFESLNRLLPALKGKVFTSSTRVPVANGAMANFYLQLKNRTTAAQINDIFRKAAELEYKGILDYTNDEIVSLDIKGNSHSCIVDATQTSAIEKQVRVVAWFDNEYGYTSRVIDWLSYWNNA